jgi:RimJ/RimL family protein N-acetyltransferase
MNISPITLDGKFVRLEPQSEKHIAGYLAISEPEEIWTYLPFGPFKTVEEWQKMLEWSDSQPLPRKSLWFAIIRRTDRHVVGGTGFNQIFYADCAVEIGGTWLHPSIWRTPINTECKYLMLRHAFETHGCTRVQFKTDARNIRSQHAIERLGAVKEAVLRKHMITRGEFVRDSFVYSILDSEWQVVKSRLEGFLNRPYA